VLSKNKNNYIVYLLILFIGKKVIVVFSKPDKGLGKMHHSG